MEQIELIFADQQFQEKPRTSSKILIFYAHIEIVVACSVVNLSGFLVTTRHHTQRFWPTLEEIFLSASRSFLYLSETLLQAINPSFLDPKFSRKSKQINDY